MTNGTHPRTRRGRLRKLLGVLFFSLPDDSMSQKELDDPALVEIHSVLELMQTAWLKWYIRHVFLGSLAIALPSIAAISNFDAPTTRVLAGLGALAAALAAFLNTRGLASSYDAATQIAWTAWIRRKLGQASEEEVSSLLQQAIDVTTFKYEPIPRSNEVVADDKLKLPGPKI